MKKIDRTRHANLKATPPAGKTLTNAGAEGPPLRSAAGALTDLKLELARRQLDLVTAQAYVRKGLAAAPRKRTNAKLELSIDKCFSNGDISAAAALVERAHTAGGAKQLALAIEIFEAQAEAWREADPKETAKKTEDILATVAVRALECLASDPPKTDHQKALATMVAANQALACGRYEFVAYPSATAEVASADLFSNEPGLPAVCDLLDVRGGAVVGVSGALLELGARGAELVVSVDANPAIPSLMLFISAMLLAVDAKAQATGLDADAQAALFVDWLRRGPHEDTTKALAELGYPKGRLGEVKGQLEAVATALRTGSIRGWPLPKTVWCQGPNAGEHVKHLTRLALEGRIVSVSADLADGEVVSRINRVLELHGLSAKAFHFSNALDYIPNVRGTFANFEKVHRSDGAVITTTAYFVRQAGERLKKTELTNALGTLDAPAALVADEWFGAKANALHDLLWSDSAHRSGLIRKTLANAKKTAPAEMPTDYAGLAALVQS